MLKRQYSKDEFQKDESQFIKRRKGEVSPVSVADIQSATTSPRSVTPSMSLNMGMMGLSLQRPSELDMAEKKNIHPSLHTTWDNHPKERKHIREKSDELYKKVNAQNKKNAEALANMDDIDKPYNKVSYGNLEPISRVYHTQYVEGDQKTFNEMEADNLTFGGRLRNTRKNNKSKKSKKSKKSLKPAKRPTKKSSKRIDKCVISKTKKYRTRSSPPYPANQCPGAKKMGNDGRYYKSVADVNRVYKWARVAK
jgi:hypothetical protein